MKMRPKKVVHKFVQTFNNADVESLANLYSDDAINHQVAERPVEGREAIRKMFADSFAEADMTWIVESIFEDGEWAFMY